MKKLFSAATSLIMAATAVASSVVPFATGAADDKKGIELRAFEGASTTISADAISAGDVTVPVGVYLVEGTNDSQSLNFQATVKAGSSTADPASVKFDLIQAGGKVNSEEKEYKVGGETYTTDILINFCSTLAVNKKGKVTAAISGDASGSATESNKKAGTDYAYAGYAWSTSSGYSWTGSTSDEFPIAVISVTFPKGTAAGKYTIDFCDYAYDEKYPENKSCMIEAGTTKYTTNNNNLDLKTIDITIGDAGEDTPVVTTTAKPDDTPTVTTTAKPDDTPTVTTTAKPADDTPAVVTPDPAQGAESKFTPVSDFVIDLNNGGKGYTFTLDEIKSMTDFEIPVKISEMGSHKTAKLIAKPGTSPAGLDIVSDDNTNYAFNDAVWKKDGETYYCDTLLSSGDSASASDYSLSDEILLLTANIDANSIKAGTYTYTLARFDVAEDGTGKNEIAPLIIPAVITITDGDTPVETTTAAPVATTTTTTAAVVQTTTTVDNTEKTTTTVATAAPTGDALYGDANDNGTVNIADVVVLNKWLNNNADYAITAQGKVNADCCDPKGGADINASDSDAIIRSIVHRITLPTTSDALKADQAKD